MLLAASQLTSLVLNTVIVRAEGGGMSSGASLLGAVANMQQLVSLKLLYLRGAEWPAPGTVFAQGALTGSTRLRQLEVQRCGLPQHVWVHELSPVCSLPALTRLVMCDDGARWGADLSTKLVACCPGLLDLGVRPSGVAAVVALKPLTAITSLLLDMLFYIGAGQLSDCVETVASLATLRRLDISFMPTSLCYPVLRPLASLRVALLTWCRLYGVLTERSMYLNAENKVSCLRI